MNDYWVSLVQFLNGYYLHVRAENEEIVREFCSEWLGKLWCSVYDHTWNIRSSQYILPTTVNVTKDEYTGQIYVNW